MFTASRFTTIPTKKCRNRLELALSNRKPISRRERNRAAVIAVQSALSDLNRAYLLSAEVDGFFGSRTYDAIESFQRDYGLVADGQAGKQTLSQLDELFNEDIFRKPTGVSIHIGVDRVNEVHYGSSYLLDSCENDANKMHEIAEALGYDAVTLVNEDATVLNFTSFMRNAIENLYEGDSILVSFSGHGSQIPNTAIDTEDDYRDETLCFYDRMLIDDELYALLGQFKEGVRVHLVFDSCHSGTVAKKIEVAKDEYMEKSLLNIKEIKESSAVLMDNGVTVENDDVEMSTVPIASKSLAKALDGEKPEFVDLPIIKEQDAKDIANLFAEMFDTENKAPSKNIEIFNHIYDRNKELYETVKNLIGSKENQQLLCSVVSISACQDSQTTPAGSVLSLFTANIDKIWRAGIFNGSYREFHKAIVQSINRQDVVPAINTYGNNRAKARLYERPFVF